MSQTKSNWFPIKHVKLPQLFYLLLRINVLTWSLSNGKRSTFLLIFGHINNLFSVSHLDRSIK